MSKQRQIAWTQTKLTQLKQAYEANKNADRFTLTLDPEGEIVLIPGYVKYLIEYLESQFSKAAPAARPANEGEESYTPGSGSWEGAE